MSPLIKGKRPGEAGPGSFEQRKHAELMSLDNFEPNLQMFGSIMSGISRPTDIANSKQFVRDSRASPTRPAHHDVIDSVNPLVSPVRSQNEKARRPLSKGREQ
jgi:hypothetical protein